MVSKSFIGINLNMWEKVINYRNIDIVMNFENRAPQKSRQRGRFKTTYKNKTCPASTI